MSTLLELDLRINLKRLDTAFSDMIRNMIRIMIRSCAQAQRMSKLCTSAAQQGCSVLFAAHAIGDAASPSPEEMPDPELLKLRSFLPLAVLSQHASDEGIWSGGFSLSRALGGSRPNQPESAQARAD